MASMATVEREPSMLQQNKSHGMGHSLIAPLFGQPVDLAECGGGEPRRRQTRSPKAAGHPLERDAHTAPEPRKQRARSEEPSAGNAPGAPHAFPDYLFRINADNTIVDVLRGPQMPMALPTYDFDGKSRDSGFAEKLWDTVHRVRCTGAPRRIEQRSVKHGHETLFEIWLAPTLTSALVGIVRTITGSSFATDAVREGDAATRQAISELWKEKHRLQGERDRLLRLATRDRLTGLWNRRAIFERLDEALNEAHASNPEVSVILADVDGLKNINDRFGHRIGDAVLREIARRFCFCVRRSDELGRFGGEEFLIVLPGCGGQAAAMRVAEFRAAIEGELITIDGKQLAVSCSFGMHTVIRCGGGCDEVVGEAEAALRRAKQVGRAARAIFKKH